MGQGATSVIGAGIGSVLSGYNPVGALVGAVAPGAVSWGARNYLLSKMGQRRAMPEYDRPMLNFLANQPMTPELRNALLAVPANQNALVQ